MKKVLFVQTRSFTENGSGVPRVTYNLGKHFTEMGLEVAYFSTKKAGHIKVDYGTLFHVDYDVKLKNKNNLNTLEQCIRKFKPDVVINQMPYDSMLRTTLADLKLNYGFQLIACIHNSLFTYKNSVKQIMKRSLPSPLSHIMANNPFYKIPLSVHKSKHRKQLISILVAHDITLLFTPPNLEELSYFLTKKDLKYANVGLMPNPVMRISTKLPEKEKVILHVGSINIHQKRSDLLLDFWEYTHNFLPDWTFKIVGAGEYLNTMKKDLEQRQLPRVELLGFQQPDDYYKKAAVFMMPSAYEGLPNTILEAHSYGCPVIAFDSYPALKWIVKENKNALLAKPYRTDEMANLVVELCKNPDRLKKMQNHALANAQRFSVDKIGKQWVELFNSLN